MPMKLYIWDDVLTDYTSGIIVALASSVDEARLAVLQQWDRDSARQGEAPKVRKSIDDPAHAYKGGVYAAVMERPKVFEVTRMDPVVRIVWGGS